MDVTMAQSQTAQHVVGDFEHEHSHPPTVHTHDHYHVSPDVGREGGATAKLCLTGMSFVVLQCLFRANRPTVAIGSPYARVGPAGLHQFYGPRSGGHALRYQVLAEDFGFEVLTSESPDFPHPLDRNAIAALLTPIADCDHYVLLVGTRVGAVVVDEGISVTRAEFRRARELRRATGKPLMLHLVRAEVDAARHLGKPARGLSGEDWTAIVGFLVM